MIPDWLVPVREAAGRIQPEDLSRFLPPDDAQTRQGAVLILFGEGPDGPDLLLTERAHDMRSHPGQVSFPGGSIDAGEAPAETALREAVEETGLDPAGVEVFGELPELFLPPSNFAVTPVLAWWAVSSPVGVVDPAEVHAVYRVPVSELVDPEHRISLRLPNGWVAPAFLIGDTKDLLLWGWTGGVIARLFDYLGWARPWDETRVRDMPPELLRGGPGRLPSADPVEPVEPVESVEPVDPVAAEMRGEP